MSPDAVLGIPWALISNLFSGLVLLIVTAVLNVMRGIRKDLHEFALAQERQRGAIEKHEALDARQFTDHDRRIVDLEAWRQKQIDRALAHDR